MTDSAFESSQTSINPTDVEKAWNMANAQEGDEASSEENATPEVTEENVQESLTEEVVSENTETPEEVAGILPVTSSEPIVLRKQKKQMQARIRQLEAENAALKQPVIPALEQTAAGIADPETGQPIDENSIEGQVLKALYKVGKADQKNRVVAQQKIEQQKLQEMYASFNEKLDAAADKYDDFEEVVRAPNVPITTAMRDTALLLPNPDDTLYAICKDKTELARFISLNPVDQAREMIEVSAQLRQTTAPSKKVTKTMTPLRNNPAVRSPFRDINEKSSVSDIRERIKKGWR